MNVVLVMFVSVTVVDDEADDSELEAVAAFSFSLDCAVAGVAVSVF